MQFSYILHADIYDDLCDILVGNIKKMRFWYSGHLWRGESLPRTQTGINKSWTLTEENPSVIRFQLYPCLSHRLHSNCKPVYFLNCSGLCNTWGMNKKRLVLISDFAAEITYTAFHIGLGYVITPTQNMVCNYPSMSQRVDIWQQVNIFQLYSLHKNVFHPEETVFPNASCKW